MLRSLWKYGVVSLLYLAFFLSAGLYIRERFVFAGVESWPGAPLEYFKGPGPTSKISGSSRFGPTSHTVSSGGVEYAYRVDGTLYQGYRVSPNGNEDLYQFRLRDSVVFYKPSNPKIAVLVPVPFAGKTHLLALVFTGLLAGGHLFFTIHLRNR